MNTITYYCNHAPAGQEWLAQLFLPNGQKWLVHAYGANEAEAIEKIVHLYSVETSKVRLSSTHTNKPAMSDSWNEATNAIAKVGRGSHFVGKV